MEAVVTPLEIRIGSSETIELEVGAEAQTAIRRDALRELHGALTDIKAIEEDMPALTDPTVRASLEALVAALTWAQRASSALWYLAPEYDDGAQRKRMSRGCSGHGDRRRRSTRSASML